MPTIPDFNKTLRLHAYKGNRHWHSLFYFNLYRLTVAGLFWLLSHRFINDWPLDVYSPNLFRQASRVYAVLVLLSLFGMWLRRPPFQWQLGWQVVSDIVLLSVISYASGGVQSNFGLLLLISLTAAGLISRGRITLLFAALATMGMLLAHGMDVLYKDGMTSQFIQVGLLCAAYFAVAWLAHILAKYAVDSQLLAQQRGLELLSMSEANRQVMRDMQDGVVVVDGNGLLLQMNPCAERLLHRAAHQGNRLSSAFPLLAAQYARWQETGHNQGDILTLDEGLQARLRFVPFEHEEVRGVVIFVEDMQRARAEAQQIKLAALGRLTANIAHEVRNPLSAISHASELLAEDLNDPAQQRLLQIVLANTQRINQIVQDVMQLNRRDRAQPESVDLPPVLSSFLEEFCQSQKISPEIGDLQTPPSCRVHFDRGHLNQVLWNLCHNSLRYGQNRPGSLRLILQHTPQQTSLCIQDDGPGIPSELHGHVFEPFFTTEKEGTGLGLYIAKELCEANNTRLEYVSTDGTTGACFRMIFGEVE